MMFGEDTFIELKFKLVDNSAYAMKVDGEIYTVGELVKVTDEVKSLREENVKLNKDRSALQNINEGLQKQVHNYQDVIANNLTGIRCKELEGIIEELHEVLTDCEKINKSLHQEISGQKKDIERLVKLNADLQNQFKDIEEFKTKVSDLVEEILRDVDGFESELQDQQAIIECLENDIKRLVKLNSKLVNEREELKPQQNLLGDYLKDFTATSAVKDGFCGKYANAVSGVIGETLVSVTFADNTGLSDACLKFVESLINNKTAQ